MSNTCGGLARGGGEGAGTDLEGDALPVGGVCGLDDGDGVLEVAAPAEELRVDERGRGWVVCGLTSPSRVTSLGSSGVPEARGGYFSSWMSLTGQEFRWRCEGVPEAAQHLFSIVTHTG